MPIIRSPHDSNSKTLRFDSPLDSATGFTAKQQGKQIGVSERTIFREIDILLGEGAHIAYSANRGFMENNESRLFYLLLLLFNFF